MLPNGLWKLASKLTWPGVFWKNFFFSFEVNGGLAYLAGLLELSNDWEESWMPSSLEGSGDINPCTHNSVLETVLWCCPMLSPNNSKWSFSLAFGPIVEERWADGSSKSHQELCQQSKDTPKPPAFHHPCLVVWMSFLSLPWLLGPQFKS